MGTEYSTNGEMKKLLENMVKNLKRKRLRHWSSYRWKSKKWIFNKQGVWVWNGFQCRRTMSINGP